MDNQQIENANRSTDEVAYREFAQKMASRIPPSSDGDDVDVLIETLKKSKYFDQL